MTILVGVICSDDEHDGLPAVSSLIAHSFRVLSQVDFAARFKELPEFRREEEPASPMLTNTPSAEELVSSYRKKRYSSATRSEDVEPLTPSSFGPLSPKERSRKSNKRPEPISSPPVITPITASPSLEGNLFFGSSFNLATMSDSMRAGTRHPDL